MTENGDLPKGWVRTPLEAVCQILDSRRIPVNNTERSRRIARKSEDNLYPYYGATGQVGLIDDFIFEGEHTLLGEDGAPFLYPFQDKSYLVDGKFWVNNHAHVLNSIISNKYVCHYLNQLDYSDHVTGTTRLKLTQNALKRIPVFVAPKEEQRRIVDKIEELFSELDKGDESLKAARAQLITYRQAVLKHAFEGKLTAQWREENKDKLGTPEQLLARINHERAARYEKQLREWKAAVKGWEAKGKLGKKPAKTKPENDQPSIVKEDRERLLNLPNGWAWIGLAHLFSTSPQNGVYKPASEYGSGTQIIRIDDFYDGQLVRRTGFKKLRLSNEEIEKYKVRNLDLIINRVNSIEFLGKCALVHSLTEDTVFESNIMKCCVIEDLISKSYVAAYLASYEGHNRLCENAKHAVNQASINQTDVGNTLVPITSIEDQLLIVKKIEQKLSQADALIFQIEAHLKKAEALRQSTLKRAFSGQLVAQDPRDEHASFLLDTIRAEKEQTCKNGKSPKKNQKEKEDGWMNTAPIVSKVWSFCTTLRDDGVGYGDYLEQLTYLIFLKMADKYANPPYNRGVGIPGEYNWQSLKSKRGAELEGHYIALLPELGTKKGMLGQIFTKAQNKIQDPAKLYRLIDMVDDTEWITMGADIKGDIYEDLLERNAEDTKSGAGQYFTPRALIRAMVECVRPEPGKLIADPACGTGGFFLAAYDFMTNPDNFKLDKEQKAFLKHEAFHGNEIVANTRRLCLMNMFLHNIGEIDGGAPISSNDSLVADAGKRFDYVLANPPFGKKSSTRFTNEEGEQKKDDLTYNRQNFWATTSNKQLNFVQQIRTMLKTTGRAAVVVPDNVLFEGGAGETIRQKLLDNTDLHTILRLPTDVFYAQGVKANVIFFDNREASPTPWTKQVWYYDYRTNVHHTLKKKPMRFEDLSDFVRCYNPRNRHERKATWDEGNTVEGRWHSYSYEEIRARDKTNLDIFWLRDKSLTDLDNLPEPDDLAEEIIENLKACLNSFREVLSGLRHSG